MFLSKVSEVRNRILKEIAVLECEYGKSFRARSHNLFIDFLDVSVLSDTVVYSAIPYEKIKAYMFLRRSLVHISYIWGLGLPPPPHTKKLATLLFPAFDHQKSGQMKMADSVPPPPPLATRNRRHWFKSFY